MDALLTVIALLVPVLMGSAWLNLLVPAGTPARPALVLGSGTLLGILLLPQLMRLQSSVGLGLNFQVTAVSATALILVAVITHRLRQTHRAYSPPRHLPH